MLHIRQVLLQVSRWWEYQECCHRVSLGNQGPEKGGSPMTRVRMFHLGGTSRSRDLRWECTWCVWGHVCGCNKINGRIVRTEITGVMEGVLRVGRAWTPSFCLPWQPSPLKTELVLVPALRWLDSAYWLDWPMLSPDREEERIGTEEAVVVGQSFHRSSILEASEEISSDACISEWPGKSQRKKQQVVPPLRVRNLREVLSQGST